MKNADVFIVRVLPFVLYILLGINIFMSKNGTDMRDLYILHSNSAVYAAALFVVSLCNKKYHCVYNRLMYIVLILTPVLNFLDYEFELFEPTNSQYIFMLYMYLVVLIVTAILAINHFTQSIKRKKQC